MRSPFELPFVFAYLATFLISAILVWAVWKHRAGPGGNWLVLSTIAISQWSLVAAIEALIIDPAQKILCSQILYIGFSAVSPFLILFTLTYLGTSISARGMLAIFLIPALTLVFALTNAWHGWVWSGFVLGDAQANVLIYQHGFWFWVHTGYIYAAALFVYFRLIHDWASFNFLYQRQIAALMVAYMFPLLSGTMYIFRITLIPHLDITPIGFLGTVLVIYLALLRFRLLDFLPVAYNLFFEQTDDGILVLDARGRVMQVNPAAQKFLQIPQASLVGHTLETVSAEIAEFFSEIKLRQGSEKMFSLHGIPTQVKTTPLMIRGRGYAGDLMILRDVSDWVEAEQLKVAESNRQFAWQERQKIARTLHDSITQYLNSLVLSAETASQRLEQAKYEQVESVMSRITTSSRLALSEMRALITELQLESTADLGFDLVKAITERIAQVGSQAETQIHFEAPPSLSLEAAQQREIFYILLEALNNALRHSGADTISISLRQGDGLFMAEVADNGCGFDPNQVRIGGMGLINMCERTRQFAGQFFIESAPGTGTRIRLQLPVRRRLETAQQPQGI